MEITIADASEALLPQIQRIEQQSFSVPWTEQMLRMQLDPDSHVFLTAEADGGVVGYIGMMYVLDEGYISNVAVHPDFRRRGVADALLDALEARARALLLSFLTLEVRQSNAPAVALYEKHGYRIAGRRRNYYEKPTEDALLMTLTLS
jgi:ribosomal-protein-alanine N-acetyltransferase